MFIAQSFLFNIDFILNWKNLVFKFAQRCATNEHVLEL